VSGLRGAPVSGTKDIPEESARQIASDQVRSYAEAQVSLLIGAVVTAVVAASVVHEAVGNAALVWLSMLLPIAAWRLYLLLAYRARPDRWPASTWLLANRTGIAANGLLWAAACVFLFVPDRPDLQAFLVVMVAGMCAGSVAFAGFDFLGAMLFVAPTALAMAARLLVHGSTTSMSLAALVTLFMGLVVFNGLRVRRSAREATALRVTRELQNRRLQVSEQRLREAQSVAQLGSYDWSPVTGELDWSDEHFVLWGYAPGEVTPSYEAFLARIHRPSDARCRVPSPTNANTGSACRTAGRAGSAAAAS
jgi:hypothetical protein